MSSVSRPHHSSFCSLPPHFAEQYGPWAVVTGASAGLGAAFASELAASGLHVVLVARRRDALRALARTLRVEHGVQARVVVADLASRRGRDRVVRQTRDLDVGLLVANAAAARVGAFAPLGLGGGAATLTTGGGPSPEAMVQLNVVATAALAHAFLLRFLARSGERAGAGGNQMLEKRRRRAGLLLVGSRSRRATPFFATYTATKAFVSELAVGLRGELAAFNRKRSAAGGGGGSGAQVDVCVLEPGLVRSEMSAALATAFRPWVRRRLPGGMDASRCASEGLRALALGRARWTPGLGARASTWVMAAVPERVRVAVLRWVSLRVLEPELL